MAVSGGRWVLPPSLVSCEEEDTCVSYEEEDTCVSGGRWVLPPSLVSYVHTCLYVCVLVCVCVVVCCVWFCVWLCVWLCVCLCVCVCVCVCVCHSAIIFMTMMTYIVVTVRLNDWRKKFRCFFVCFLYLSSLV
jgi:hypothetical protein